MKISFIGTSHGFPEPNRRCSSAMVTVGNGKNARRYFIDMGTQAAEDLTNMGLSFESVKAVFLTHMHGDHTYGLLSFIDLISWYYKEATTEFYFTEEEAIPAFVNLITVMGTNVRDNIKMKTVKEGLVYDDGCLKVTAYRTKHCAVSYAYLLEAEGKRVLFSGDLSYKGPKDDFPIECAKDQKLDLAICETAHFSATEYEPVFRMCKIDRVVMNHYSKFFIETDYQLMRLMPELDISLATDGMEIEL